MHCSTCCCASGGWGKHHSLAWLEQSQERAVKKQLCFQASRCSKRGIHWMVTKLERITMDRVLGKSTGSAGPLTRESWQLLGLFKTNQHKQTNREYAKELLQKQETDTTEVVYQNRVKESQNKMKQQICLCIYSRMFPCVLISLAASPLLLSWWHMILSGEMITHLLKVTIKISSLWYITVLKAKIYYDSCAFIFILKNK